MTQDTLAMGQQQGFLLITNEHGAETGFGPHPCSRTADPEDAHGNHPFEVQGYKKG